MPGVQALYGMKIKRVDFILRYDTCSTGLLKWLKLTIIIWINGVDFLV